MSKISIRKYIGMIKGYEKEHCAFLIFFTGFVILFIISFYYSNSLLNLIRNIFLCVASGIESFLLWSTGEEYVKRQKIKKRG